MQLDDVPVDEINDYWNGRYLSSGEAVWRILGFNITKKEPSVTTMSVHLVNDRTFVQYHRNGGSNSLSNLQHYFLRPLGSFIHNDVVRRFEDLTFIEYFSLFRLKKFDPGKVHAENYYMEQLAPNGCPPMHVVLRTARYRHYARIREVPLARGELFYLRALLLLRPASSFTDARTIHGVEQESFQSAASALGIFADQTIAEFAMNESIRSLKTPNQLRILFVDLLTDNSILTPLRFWNTFQYHLCRDFTLRNPDLPQIGIDHALDHVARLLEEYGKHLSDFQLPEPATYGRKIEHELQRWAPFSEQLAQKAHDAYQSFNPEQKQIFDEILLAVTENRPLLLFIDGKAGVGKSFLINAICNRLRSLNIITLPTASSAFAAQLYPGGRTAHSTFKVRRHPINCTFSNNIHMSI